MEEKLKRLYRIEDTAVIVRAETMHGNLEQRLAAFTAKFPGVDINFLNDFAAEIAAARQFPADGQVTNEKRVLTEDVTTTMTEADAALQTVASYARLAYATDPTRRKVFGQSQWASARKNRKKMFDVLTNVYALVSQEPYKTELGNKGFTVANADALRDIALLLDERKLPQAQATKERKIKTADRIALHNAIWNRMTDIKICAELVYRDDYALRNLFRLYQAHDKKMTTVKVMVLSNDKPLAEAAVKLSHLSKARLTDKKGTLQFLSRTMPAKITGEASHQDFGKAIFSVEVKAGKMNKVVVEIT